MENSTYQKALADTTQMYERKLAELFKQIKDNCTRIEDLEEQLGFTKKLLSDHQNLTQVSNIPIT